MTKYLIISFALFNSCFSTLAVPGEFSATIKTVTVIPQDGWLILNAQLNYMTSPQAKAAIKSSIPLYWDLKIQLKQPRYFHDNLVSTFNFRYLIRYHALLNSYSVKNETTHTFKKYATLAEALDAISPLQNIKLLPLTTLNNKTAYQLNLQIVFDKEQLPSPLRPLAYFDPEWDLSSDSTVMDIYAH